jgi:CubicO group peptidase (beta-lactamase class C family)
LVPEVGGTAYQGATMRRLLDIRAGVAFDEDYLATSGPIITYRKATNWVPLDPGEVPSDLRSFFRTMTERDGPHGGRFHYVSPNTDLLGWVIERVTGRRYPDLISALIWRPMGAARSAYITVDRLGRATRRRRHLRHPPRSGAGRPADCKWRNPRRQTGIATRLA